MVGLSPESLAYYQQYALAAKNLQSCSITVSNIQMQMLQGTSGSTGVSYGQSFSDTFTATPTGTSVTRNGVTASTTFSQHD
jgi:hypothetical protein